MAMEQSFLINYKEVDINYRHMCVLSNVNIKVHKGDFVYIIGKVGSGKSSLLKTFYYDLQIYKGEANVLNFNLRRIKKNEIPYLRRKLGIVFQDFQLLTDRSVNDNLLFVLKAIGWKNNSTINERIEEVLKMVGMQTKGFKMPHQLSGGEQQRIAIARALLNEPDIVLADEPTGNLDVETGTQIMDLLHKINKKGTAVVLTTHNLSWLSQYPATTYECKEGKLNCLSRNTSL